MHTRYDECSIYNIFLFFKVPDETYISVEGMENLDEHRKAYLN